MKEVLTENDPQERNFWRSVKDLQRVLRCFISESRLRDRIFKSVAKSQRHHLRSQAFLSSLAQILGLLMQQMSIDFEVLFSI